MADLQVSKWLFSCQRLKMYLSDMIEVASKPADVWIFRVLRNPFKSSDGGVREGSPLTKPGIVNDFVQNFAFLKDFPYTSLYSNLPKLINHCSLLPLSLRQSEFSHRAAAVARNEILFLVNCIRYHRFFTIKDIGRLSKGSQ